MLRTADKRLFVGDHLSGVFPASFPMAFEAVGVNTGTSKGTTVTASGSTNTKGSYVELTAATTISADGFLLTVDTPAGGIDHMMDIAVGGAGSEVVILSNFSTELYFGGGSPSVFVPVPIQAGSRISARMQANQGSVSDNVSLVLVKGGLARMMGLKRATTYGADTATSTGTQVPYAGSTNTKGAWVELTSSTVGRTRLLIVLVGLRGGSNIATTNYSLFDIGVGASSSEVAVVSNVSTVGDANTDRYWPNVYTIPVDIPAGSRLVARAQHSGNVPYDMIAIGLS